MPSNGSSSSQQDSGGASSSSSAAGVGVVDDIMVPCGFICPISLQVMVHPLMTKSGHSFERSAILDWLEADCNGGSCPLTRRPLKPSDLVPNRKLEDQIRFWKIQHGLEPRAEEEEEDNDDDRGNKFMGFVLNELPLLAPPRGLSAEVGSTGLQHHQLQPQEQQGASSSSAAKSSRGTERRRFLSRLLRKADREAR